jgi:sialate O-acetylesterase
MQWIVSSLPSAKDEIAAANFPKIRLFTVTRAVGEPKPYELGKGWAECSPTTVGSFSAVGYFFGRELHKSLDGVAIGLVASSWGGTPCESWTSQAALEANPEFKSILDRYAGQLKEYPEKKKEYDAALAKYEEAVKKATTDGTKPPAKPMAPVGPDSPYRPSGLWSAMIQPLTPMAIRGVIWYQGEANASRGQQYRTLFPAMITDWRKQWGLGDFPFLFVQLANFRERAAQPGESGWAELRDAQLSTLRVPATAMAVAIDIGEAGNIHPANKQDVGKRLCLGALKVAYGRDLVYSGPIYQSMKVEGNKVRLTFAHTGKGLEAKGGELKGFAIAGADKKFVWAKAAIDGQTVVVSADEVAAPVAVRYGWADNPECTLYNADGLPASPFRTDGPTDAK